MKDKFSTASGSRASGNEADSVRRDPAILEEDEFTRGWLKETMRAASGVAGFTLAALFMIDCLRRPIDARLVVLHLLRVIPPFVYCALVGWRWFTRRWRAATLTAASLMLVASAGLASVQGGGEQFVYLAIILLISVGAVLPWSARWQGAVTTVAVAGLLTIARFHPGDARFFTSSVELIGAAALAFCFNLTTARYRREISKQLRMLRKVFGTTPETIGLSSLAEGKFIEVGNPELLGYTRDEALGARAEDLGLWADLGDRDEYVRRLKQHGIVHSLEIRLRKKSGMIVPALMSGTVFELDGQPHVLSFTRVISEIKQAQEDLVEAREALAAQVAALRESQTRLRLEVLERETTQQQLAEREAMIRKIYDTTLETITINRLSDGVFVEVNDEFTRCYGYAREEVIGQSAVAIALWPYPRQLRQFMAELRAKGILRDFETALRAKDGRIVPIVTSAVVVELRGEPCIVGLARDITERRRAEREIIEAREAAMAQSKELAAQVAALYESEARLRAEIVERETAQLKLAENENVIRKIFDLALETISIHRLRDGAFIDVNAEFTRRFGYTREAVIGKSAAAIGAWPDLQRLKQMMAEVRANGSVRNFDAELRTKDGTIVPVQTSVVAVELRGEPCIIALSHDMTTQRTVEREIVAAREAALAASRAKSEFLSTMSHEIRTPMNAILGMGEVLTETKLDEEQRRFVEMMRSNGNALLELIDSILDLAKVESGLLRLETAEFNLSEIIERTVETLGVRAYAKGLELVSVIAPHLPRMVIGDPMRLRQILINLIGNAIKFTDRGAIELTVAGTPDPANGRWSMEFVVADTGIGIAAKALAELFAPFTQADSSTARKYGGSGLGLSIVKRLVELMGGAIRVESEPGKGSAFRFALPLTASADQPDATIAIAQALLRGKRILVADHYPANRRIIRDWLETRGAEVLEAETGDQARSAIAAAGNSARSYDLAFLDAQGDGAAAFALARACLAPANGAPRPAAAIALMLAPHELGIQLNRLRELGIGAAQRGYYLVKPVKPSEVARIVTLAFASAGEVISPVARDVPVARANGASTGLVTPMRILVADDSTDNRMLIQVYLRHLPHQIDFAEDGGAAIDLAKANRYQLILMDIQMPTVDGYAATRAIRELEVARGYRPSRIIALTASALGDAVRKSLEAGCDAHIAKPVRKATLLEAIDEVSHCNELDGGRPKRAVTAEEGRDEQTDRAHRSGFE